MTPATFKAGFISAVPSASYHAPPPFSIILAPPFVSTSSLASSSSKTETVAGKRQRSCCEALERTVVLADGTCRFRPITAKVARQTLITEGIALMRPLRIYIQERPSSAHQPYVSMSQDAPPICMSRLPKRTFEVYHPVPGTASTPIHYASIEGSVAEFQVAFHLSGRSFNSREPARSHRLFGSRSNPPKRHDRRCSISRRSAGPLRG